MGEFIIIIALWAVAGKLEDLLSFFKTTRDHYSFEEYAKGKYRITPAKSDLNGKWY